MLNASLNKGNHKLPYSRQQPMFCGERGRNPVSKDEAALTFIENRTRRLLMVLLPGTICDSQRLVLCGIKEPNVSGFHRIRKRFQDALVYCSPVLKPVQAGNGGFAYAGRCFVRPAQNPTGGSRLCRCHWRNCPPRSFLHRFKPHFSCVRKIE